MRGTVRPTPNRCAAPAPTFPFPTERAIVFATTHLSKTHAQQLHIRVRERPDAEVVPGLLLEQGIQAPAFHTPPDELHLRHASVNLQGSIRHAPKNNQMRPT